MATSTSFKNNSSDKSRHQGTVCDSCPHWSPGTQSCLVVQDGLFLPTTEHIITYCETPYFSSCSYYQQHLQQRHYQEVSDGEWQNRRLHQRMPFRQIFRFTEKKENGSNGEFRDDSACTIDLSEGGIRFETRMKLPVDTNISFILENEDGPLQGNGRIVWSKPIEKSPMYHCGFVFTSSGSSRDIERLLSDLTP